MMTRPLPLSYDPDLWMGRSGKASYYPDTPQFRVNGNQLPAGILQPGGLITGPMMHITPRKPRLMMDPSDPTTFQRPYQFTGGQIG